MHNWLLTGCRPHSSLNLVSLLAFSSSLCPMCETLPESVHHPVHSTEGLRRTRSRPSRSPLICGGTFSLLSSPTNGVNLTA
ncbi:hypothetical protein BKA67DRAFT_546159 [Truncatella angustata]|uniref:Secreted protein n=1 Tax=Truncatella angustata TaxID=152316 RepID=A0A9P9A4H8_9PEZI|nr:uncharacterized protein BKA67DRAFT_546159 [Truncatella angustata]KAH6659899.1 hypothetical protein BKA67DRAFT_546159 [Truncatella angustata]